MTRFEGDRDFPQPPNEIWNRLSDARFLVRCIPDVESVGEVQPDRANLVLKPGFSFVRGTLEAELRIVDAVAPGAVRILLHSKGIGSSSDAEVGLTLAEQDGGTRVHWVVEIKTLGGLLKMVPTGLIRGAAQKVVEDVWARVAEQLAQPPAPGPAGG
jgi:carbon monoxide dehydrogenase subunit G